MKYPAASLKAVRRAVRLIGGCTKTSHALGITYAAVYAWQTGKTPPSLKRAIELSRATDGRVSAGAIRAELNGLDATANLR